MSLDRLDAAVRAGVAAGLLPPGTARPTEDSRPWPVLLLIALGAWLAALPLVGVVGVLLGDLMQRGVGPYIVGPLVLAGAVVVLRARDVALFVEQLAVPALLVGGGALGFGLFRDLPDRFACAVLAAIALGVAIALPRAWLRVLLGALAAALVAAASHPGRWLSSEAFGDGWGIAWHASLALGALLVAIQQADLGDSRAARRAAALESINAGWLLAVVAGLAFWSGMTFLVAGTLGGAAELGTGLMPRRLGSVLPALSVLLALAAAALAASRWPALRRPWCAAVALVIVLLGWPMPALGAALLALAHAASSQRWRLAGAAGVAAAWIVGAFYYQLAWPLATKSLVLLGAGAVLGLLAWLVRERADRAAAAAAPPNSRAALAALALVALGMLAVANVGIWQKQQLIEHGRPVFVELAPVDPRSLTQGDYMQLAYRLPDAALQRHLAPAAQISRPRVVARLDDRGIARIDRLADGTSLAAGELLIELTPKGGRWVIVSDAWFFREGEAQRWQRARYAEFRVAPDGRALLVDLRGPSLEKL